MSIPSTMNRNGGEVKAILQVLAEGVLCWDQPYLSSFSDIAANWESKGSFRFTDKCQLSSSVVEVIDQKSLLKGLL